MLTTQSAHRPPFTLAVRRALQGVNNSAIEADLLFLEAWEIHPTPDLGATFRASQIRRANPDLVAAIDAELKAASSAADVGPRVKSSASERTKV
jgi:hypothetical protein